jgi:transcriptional regulator with XRE-family HTH domain
VQVTMEVEDVGTLLRIWRSQSRLTTREVADKASTALGWTISYMMVTRYENNAFPTEGPNPAILAAITCALGKRISDLPAEHRDAVQKLGDLIRRSS